MHTTASLTALAALAQESRLSVFRLLVKAGPDGLPGREIAQALGITPSALSFHLKELTHACLLTPRQAGRSIIYSANLETMKDLMGYLMENCCQGHSTAPSAQTGQTADAPEETPHATPHNAQADDRVYNVLFLCTGNSARSIMAEVLVSTMGRGRFRGFSAGSRPTGVVNPLAIEQIAATGYPLATLRSKGWDEFSAPDAPHMDFVITVCDSAAGEVCPLWPGHPISAHWGFEDPALVTGSEEVRRAAFRRVYRQLVARLNVFTSLPLSMLEKNAIQAELNRIGDA